MRSSRSLPTAAAAVATATECGNSHGSDAAASEQSCRSCRHGVAYCTRRTAVEPQPPTAAMHDCCTGMAALGSAMRDSRAGSSSAAAKHAATVPTKEGCTGSRFAVSAWRSHDAYDLPERFRGERQRHLAGRSLAAKGRPEIHAPHFAELGPHWRSGWRRRNRASMTQAIKILNEVLELFSEGRSGVVACAAATDLREVRSETVKL